MASKGEPVPPELLAPEDLGLELHDILTADCPSQGLLNRRYFLLNEMLASDPLSVFDIVPTTAFRADGLICSVVIRDDIWVTIANAADDSKLHGVSPANANT